MSEAEKTKDDKPIKKKGNIKFILTIIFTISGFAAAITANLLIPQVSEKVKIEVYQVGPIYATMNNAYTWVLAALIVLYTAIGVFSYFKKERRKKYRSRAPFRFAVGIALVLWDFLGTKIQALPQPFFPGPAGIIEAFLIEGDYIIQNGYEPVYGARPLKRFLTKHVETLAARLILSGEVLEQDIIEIDYRDGELTATAVHRA